MQFSHCDHIVHSSSDGVSVITVSVSSIMSIEEAMVICILGKKSDNNSQVRQALDFTKH